MSDNLLKEVDAALRADRAEAFWNTHKRTVIAVIVAMIVAAAGDSAYQHYREAKGGEIMQGLVEAQALLKAEKPAEAAKGFATVAERASGNARAIAQIWQARALLAAQQSAEAAAVLKQASEGKGLWADIACLRLAGLDASAATTCLSRGGNSPLAIERAQWAIANQWHAGDRAAAITGLEKLIADDSVSLEAKATLEQWLAVMKAQGKE